MRAVSELSTNPGLHPGRLAVRFRDDNPRSTGQGPGRRRGLAQPFRHLPGSDGTGTERRAPAPRSKYALTTYASAKGTTRRLSPGNTNARLWSGPDGQDDGGDSAVRAMRNPVSTRRARGPGQLPAEWEQWPSTVQASIVRRHQSGQWYLLFKGRCYLQRLRRPHRCQLGRPDRPGIPASSALRPGPRRRVLRRCRILPGLRRSLLPPPLERIRERLRLLPPRPRPRQEPGPTLVGPVARVTTSV
jgi:hypothetical protein